MTALVSNTVDPTAIRIWLDDAFGKIGPMLIGLIRVSVFQSKKSS